MKRALWLGLAVIFIGNVSHADSRPHYPNKSGTVDRLLWESRNLNDEVRYSNMGYTVEDAVFRFLMDVEDLSYCASHPMRGKQIHGGDCPQHCESDLRRARYSFDTVSRYLSGSQNSFPAVHRQYQITQYALRSVTVDGGVNSFFKCTSVDNGFEEHYGGHSAYGRTINQAQLSATLECQKFHGSCRIKSCEQQQN